MSGASGGAARGSRAEAKTERVKMWGCGEMFLLARIESV